MVFCVVFSDEFLKPVSFKSEEWDNGPNLSFLPK